MNHALAQFGFSPAPQSLVRHWVGHGGKHCIEQAVAATHTDPAGTLPDPALVDAMLVAFLDHTGRTSPMRAGPIRTRWKPCARSRSESQNWR